MVSKYSKYGMFILLLVGVSIFSTWFGFKKGLEHGAAIEATSFGAISAAQIARLKSGRQEDIDNVISLFEIYVDHGLNQFYWYRENGSSFWGDFVVDEYNSSMQSSAKRLAQYRRDNPENELMKDIDNESYVQRKAVVEVLTE